jgi:hypothetical protein
MATPTTLPATFVAGNVLTAAQMNDLRGAFRVLQVIQGTTNTLVSSSSATYVDSGLTVTITPQSATSQILIIANQLVYSNASATGAGMRLYRGASTFITQTTNQSYNASGGGEIAMWSMTRLDSPATTSATTYKVMFNRDFGTGQIQVCPGSSDATIIVMEISA